MSRLLVSAQTKVRAPRDSLVSGLRRDQCELVLEGRNPRVIIIMKASVETEYKENSDLEYIENFDLLLSTCLCFKCRARRERVGGGEREREVLLTIKT